MEYKTKICAYVQTAYAKANYKNECMDTRQFIGLRVIIDCLEKEGYTVEYAGEATISKYFDVDYLFGAFTQDTLPSRYLRTYAQIEKMWGKTPLER